MTVEQAFFEWWDKPGRPTILNHRMALEAGYRAASVGRNPKGEDPAEGLRAEHEHAVPNEDSADAQKEPRP